MATQTVKGSRDANATISSFSAQLNGAWMLYCQDDILVAPPNTTYRMSKWTYFEGGSYVIATAADDSGHMLIDGTNVANIIMQVVNTGAIAISKGWHRLDVDYTNVPANTPTYVGWAFYRDGAVAPESVSSPDGWAASDSEFPDIGPKPENPPDTRLSLPVFLPRPNWESDITESWEWLTTVNTSESGAEQRRKIRRFPRRYVEASFRGFDNKRQVMDTAVSALGKNECLIPLWFDTQFIRDEYAEGGTVLQGDFQYRNFITGGIAILRGENVFDYELVPIKSVTATELTLNRPLLKTWKNFQLQPIRVSVQDAAASTTNYINRATDYQLRFRLVEAETTIDAEWSYDGSLFPINQITNLPVINLRPNWRDNLTATFDRVIFQTDNATGIPYVMDGGNQETQMWSLPLILNGPKQHYTLQKLLYAMAGQQMPFHAPTWMKDLTLTRDINSQDGALIVEQIGYTYYGAIGQDIRRWLYIEKTDGTVLLNRVAGSSIQGNEEWLFLEQTIGNIAMRDIRVVCFMPYARQSTDSVEITHHTDINGTAECMLAFQGFIERRDGTPANF